MGCLQPVLKLIYESIDCFHLVFWLRNTPHPLHLKVHEFSGAGVFFKKNLHTEKTSFQSNFKYSKK